MPPDFVDNFVNYLLSKLAKPHLSSLLLDCILNKQQIEVHINHIVNQIIRKSNHYRQGLDIIFCLTIFLCIKQALMASAFAGQAAWHPC
jgi:hypothetical protein